MRCNGGLRRTLAALGATAAVIAALAVHADTSGSAVSSRAGAVCHVTIPPKPKVPQGGGFTAASFNYGNAYLRAELYWPRGTLTAGILPDGGSMAIINRDGSIDLKLGWWRGVRGQLVIWGRRLDAHAPPLRAEAGTVASYGHEGFVPSGLTFPTVGCWRVFGGVRHARLTFVVRVTKLSRNAR
jgi:hypothetical protein